ncbi:MAG: MBL fold metallo-hydrolase [Bacteroidales bacterium]|jgi:cyclase|nr:MBL fold metallo-hydrolase [Bacteroidales bacterium]
MKIRITLFSFIIIILLFTKLSNAQENSEYIEVSDNLYLITNISGGNVAFLVTRKGIVVVDAGSTPSNGQKICSIITSVSNKPIKFLILTHFHGDHINGIAGFPQDVIIIAHKDLAKNNEIYNKKNIDNYISNILPGHLVNLKLQMGEIKDKNSKEYLALKKDFDNNYEYLEDIKNIKFRNPDITFEDYYRFKIADERIMLEYTGPGHSSDNVVVKFSNHNVIHTGDLVFKGMVPYLIIDHGVDVHNWIKTLDDLFKENILTVIPGHGEIGGKIILKEQSDYFKSLSKKIEILKNSGLSLVEIKEKIDINDFDMKGNENQFPINIEVIYTQLVGKGAEWWEF